MRINTSCPACDPGCERDTLTVEIRGRHRIVGAVIEAEVVECENGCVLTDAQRAAVEQEAIDMAFAGDLS